ncbi:MAG: succinyl-diaminopimelate desuccinylase [Gammaproteobacteria bacterium]|nr:succinyl-diaminopimelate desuccinylase [Gammaproteobacteria bacterium]
MSEVLDLTCALIERPSVTPEDAGCQDLIAEYLAPHGFVAESMPFAEVQNLWLRHGEGEPLLMFAGHTDVVPTGPLEQWASDPFSPTVRDGLLYGRGAADMKGGVAAMVVACAQYVVQRPGHPGAIGLLLTSDEEGPAVHGTRATVEQLQARQEIPAWCIVGEPSCRERLGDVIKNGRRGSLSGRLTVRGTQGHIAYPALCDNPIHRFAPALMELTETIWDEGNEDFQPTQFQVSNLNSGCGAANVVPGELTTDFNLRYSTEVTAEELQERIAGILEQAGFEHQIEWQEASLPYRTPPGTLTQICQDAVSEVLGSEAELSTEGGTSDGRFIRPTGAEVVEFGPINRSIHKIDEHVAVEDLDRLAEVYRAIIGKLLD